MFVNAYKEAWLANVMLDYSQSRNVRKTIVQHQKRRKKVTPARATEIVARQKAEAMVLKGGMELMKHAAQSQVKGRIGIGLRVGGRIGLRVIPVVGAAMLAYDLYRAYEYLTE